MLRACPARVDEQMASEGSERTQDLRKRKGAETRERILDAATELFSSQGYAGTGVSEIARRAGIEKAALYWHFRSKELLLAAVIERIDAQWIEQIRRHVAEAVEPRDRLEHFVAGLRRLVADQHHLLRLMMSIALERSEASKTRDAVRRILDRTAEVVAQEFEQSLGVALPDIDLVARMSLGYLFEATLRGAVDPDHVDLDRLFRHLRRLIALDLERQIRSG